MGNASGHQCKVKMSGGVKKVKGNTYDISSIKRVTKFHVVVVQNNGKEMYKKSVLIRAVVACENIRFSSLFAAGDVSRGETSFLHPKRRQRRRARRNGCFHRLDLLLFFTVPRRSLGRLTLHDLYFV